MWASIWDDWGCWPISIIPFSDGLGYWSWLYHAKIRFLLSLGLCALYYSDQQTATWRKVQLFYSVLSVHIADGGLTEEFLVSMPLQIKTHLPKNWRCLGTEQCANPNLAFNFSYDGLADLRLPVFCFSCDLFLQRSKVGQYWKVFYWFYLHLLVLFCLNCLSLFLM